jgi:hypothetical protein
MSRASASPGFDWRDLLVYLTLVSHLMVTLGVPLPGRSTRLRDPSHRYPCQDMPCGCQTAEECWKGDCCCFTLEDKLSWAEANGIQPPDNVRQLVEDRKNYALSAVKKSCCADAEPACSAGTRADCCAEKVGRPSRPGEPGGSVLWTVGLFALRCRCEGPIGFLEVELAVIVDPTPIWSISLDSVGQIAVRTDRAFCIPIHPSIPPPRPF